MTEKADPNILAVLDLESSGLKVTGEVPPADRVHVPGTDPDCILEVGIVLLEIVGSGETKKLVPLDRKSWLILPPGVHGKDALNGWIEVLREKNSFVYDMHSKADESGSSLFDQLRDMASGFHSVNSIVDVKNEIVALFQKYQDADKKTHPGNSNIMMVGNSIANLDIPLLRLWMPEVHNLLSYRIMDVSVLRSFYQVLAGVEFPVELAESIKSGGGGHRALSDAEYCANALEDLITFARGNKEYDKLVYEKLQTDMYENMNITLEEQAKRIDHLEMLIRYGSRTAIREERESIKAAETVYDSVRGYALIDPHRDNAGLFRKQGGILHASKADISDSVDSE